MVDILSRFKIGSQIDEQLRRRIAIFYVFDDSQYGKNILLVTSDDKLYAMGNNAFGVCGVGHNLSVNTPNEVPELMGKGIIKFCHGSRFVLALTNDHKIYSWGLNDLGQLARGYVCSDVSKPDLIAISSDICFFDMSCGQNRAMALTLDGIVYVWGDNTLDQTKRRKMMILSVFSWFKPKVIPDWLPITCLSLPKIRTIYCTEYQSFVISTDGQLYCWGQNEKQKLPTGDKDRRPVNRFLVKGINGVVSISSSVYNTYFLDKDGQLFCSTHLTEDKITYCQKVVRRIDFDAKIHSLLPNIHVNYGSKYCLILAETDDDLEVHLLDGDQVVRTSYKSYLDYCINQLQVTPETINLSLDVKQNFKGKFNPEVITPVNAINNLHSLVNHVDTSIAMNNTFLGSLRLEINYNHYTFVNNIDTSRSQMSLQKNAIKHYILDVILKDIFNCVYHWNNEDSQLRNG